MHSQRSVEESYVTRF